MDGFAAPGWWLVVMDGGTIHQRRFKKHLWKYLRRWPDGSSYIGNFEANNLPEPYIQQTSTDKCANKLTVSVEIRCDAVIHVARSGIGTYSWADGRSYTGEWGASFGRFQKILK